MAQTQPPKLLEDLWDPSAGRTVWERLVSASQTNAEALMASPERAPGDPEFFDFFANLPGEDLPAT